MKQLSFDYPDYKMLEKTGYHYGQFHESHQLKVGESIWAISWNWRSPLSGMKDEGGLICTVDYSSGEVITGIRPNDRTVYAKIIVSNPDRRAAIAATKKLCLP